MKRENIRVRDPYIVVADGNYYLYSANCSVDGTTIEVYRSQDLENWDEPTIVYKLSTDSWKSKELWAPEVHKYGEKYYMFLSILGKSGLRGTEISVSDTPDGLFVPLVDRPATPISQSCIDGTLFVDEGKPYMVYSHDWPDNYVPSLGAYVGQICAVELSEDLRESVGEPFLLFNSTDVPYSAKAATPSYLKDDLVMRYGSDAPFINKLKNGKLFLTWSPYPGNTYVVLGAVADTIRGPWMHLEKPLFEDNGGHAMFFTDFDGTKKMCIHHPEADQKERAKILTVAETENELRILL